jgi:hypothetical protein
MNAALISIVLMSGACGQVPMDEEPCDFLAYQSITVSLPPLNPAHGCAACGNSVVPPLYQGCPQYSQPQLHTTPAFNTDYRPACYFYPNHQMLFHAANYAQPYPYWERFNYPWNDPRCPCAVPPIGY